MTMYYKYPRTYHLPWSNPSRDDKVAESIENFVGKQVVVMEKLDGENTNFYRDKIHARSIDSAHHPSQAWVKGLHAAICNDLPEGYRITGENLQAKHSIYYDSLTSYFYVFAVYNENNICLSWDDVVEISTLLGLQTAPVLYRGVWDKDKIMACYTGRSVFGQEQEGYVVRMADSFHFDNHSSNILKYVRPNHVPGDAEHWSKTSFLPNKLVK